MAPVIPDRGTRQGPRGRSVLYVLVGSLVLLGIVLVGVMTWSAKQPPDMATPSQDASRKLTTGSPSGSSSGTSSSNSGGAPAANPAYPAPSESKR
jgi:hypothetical protein